MASFDTIIGLDAEHLVQCHMRPISGRAAGREALSAYRDGLRSVLEQTLDGIRRGRTPDELVQEVRLPPALAASPYLQEYYGAVSWTVRGIYADVVGWFDGNPTGISPLPPPDRAARMLEMVGGVDALLGHARSAVNRGDVQWAAELVDHVLVLDEHHPTARRLKAEALRELAERQVNATARNYYLTCALALERD